MVTRQQRLNDFESNGQPPAGELMELLCEDHNGTYVLPFPCLWVAQTEIQRDGARRRSAANESRAGERGETPAHRRADLSQAQGGGGAAGARAQQPAMPVVGFLNAESPAGCQPMAAAFRQALQQSGYAP